MNLTSLVTMLIATGLVVPHATLAATSNSIQVSVQGGTVITESHSSASSGGQTVTSGGNVSTGDSSASSRVETNISSGSDGGTLDVTFESTENGVTQKESYAKEFAPGEKIQVVVGAGTSTKAKSSSPAQSEALAQKKTATTSTVTVAGSTTVVASATVSRTARSLTHTLFSEKIPTLFKKVFAFLWWF